MCFDLYSANVSNFHALVVSHGSEIQLKWVIIYIVYVTIKSIVL